MPPSQLVIRTYSTRDCRHLCLQLANRGECYPCTTTHRPRMTQTQSSSVQILQAPLRAPCPLANAQARKSPLGLWFTRRNIQMTGSGLPTVCCLKGRAHCATAPNQKRPQKSNPAKRPRLCSPAASPADQSGGGNPAAPPMGKIWTIMNDQSELQMTIQVGQ